MHPASTTPTALLLVDIQQSFENPANWGPSRSTPGFEENVTALLKAARAHNATSPSRPILIIHVHHHSKDPDSALHPSYKLAGSDSLAVTAAHYATPLPSESVVVKNVNSSFIGTDLESRLRSFGARQLVVAGLTTDHCVSTTVRMAANLEVLGNEGGPDGSGPGHHGVVMLGDATATFSRGGFDAETVHAVHLASLDGEFATVRATAEVIGDVMRVG